MQLKEYIVKALAECAGTNTKEITFDIGVYAAGQNIRVSEDSTNRIKFTVAVGRKETPDATN